MSVTVQPFRFSPRPNRAHEIRWREWGREALDEAGKADRPVLLSISGVWCHWCHVMDETSYSDPEVIKLINESFVPVRVDTDQRPDVNERYNLGGWPTTAVLSPDGELMGGGTYIPPDQMVPWLEGVVETWRDEHEDMGRRLAERRRAVARTPATAQPGHLDADIYRHVIRSLRDSFDDRHAGFGRGAKFPLVEAIELAMDGYVTTRDDDLRNIFARTIAAMVDGGLYDHVEGGFFRYSTTRDWSVPHYEKMLEDNAALLGALLDAVRIVGTPKLRGAARDVVRFLNEVLYQPPYGVYAGTQDADEEYYRLDIKERRQRKAPAIDRNVYVNWNADLVRVLVEASWVLDVVDHLQRAIAVMDFLLDHAYAEDRGMAHYLPAPPTAVVRNDAPSEQGASLPVAPSGRGMWKPQLWGLLTDQVSSGRALVRLYHSTGDDRWLKTAERLADFILKDFRAPDGGFRDLRPDREAPGELARPKVALEGNARAARFLLELAATVLDEERAERYRREAVSALGRFADTYRDYGVMASGYALAVADALRPWTVVTIIGDRRDARTAELKDVAWAAYRPQTVIRLLDPVEKAEVTEALGFGRDPDPRAYVCVGTKCLAPVSESSVLRGILEKEAVREVAEGPVTRLTGAADEGGREEDFVEPPDA
ncbi:MAG: thioredoxin domain-containing protein [Bacillota bacterium]